MPGRHASLHSAEFGQGFLRDHLGPLAGSLGLHLLLVALLAITALRWTSSQPPVQLAIEAVIVDAGDLPRAAVTKPARPSTPPVRAEPPKPVPQVRPAEAVPKQEPVPAVDEAAERRADAERAARERAAAAQQRQQAALERQAAQQREREAAERAAAEKAARRTAELEAQQKAEREAEQNAKLEAQQKARMDAQQKAEREAELQRRLAAEEDEASLARSGVVDEYRALLIQAIERNWIRPPTARAGLECTLHVNQAPGGTVIDVRVGACNGDAAVRESIVNAVHRASPLPSPRDARAFQRRLEIVFKPAE